MNKGFFISIEGGEGAGKSTIAKNMEKALSMLGKEVVLTREPGGCKEAENIRAKIMADKNIDIETEIMLFAVARKAHYERVIKPALQQNKIVICDRYIHSNLVYQGYINDCKYQTNVFTEKVLNINKLMDVAYPDITFHIDTDVKTGLKRIHENNRETNRFDLMDESFHEQIHDGFQSFYGKNPIDNCFWTINGNQSKEKLEHLIDWYMKQIFIMSNR